ncbi:MAG: S-ribosylhomocysteine lyase [Ruminococcaceae bacterium]|nr:S-ribosylhomocysteine lyase [Oscillospiraceae bacterium]
MEKIASFQVDHTVLLPGMYVSRVDGDVTTFDLRFVRPNTPPYLTMPAVHTLEHLFATYARNSAHKDKVIYFGPMGCRTGFYFLTRDLSREEALTLTQEALAFVAAYDGDIPGVSAVECGNWLEHDLDGARAYAAAMVNVLRDWTAEKMDY